MAIKFPPSPKTLGEFTKRQNKRKQDMANSDEQGGPKIWPSTSDRTRPPSHEMDLPPDRPGTKRDSNSNLKTDGNPSGSTMPTDYHFYENRFSPYPSVPMPPTDGPPLEFDQPVARPAIPSLRRLGTPFLPLLLASHCSLADNAKDRLANIKGAVDLRLKLHLEGNLIAGFQPRGTLGKGGVESLSVNAYRSRSALYGAYAGMLTSAGEAPVVTQTPPSAVHARGAERAELQMAADSHRESKENK